MADETTDWQMRRAAAMVAEEQEWDRLSEAFEADWKAAYCVAFRRVARGRGWSDEDIESGWLDDLPSDALVFYGDRDPNDVAAEDVISCEVEAANA